MPRPDQGPSPLLSVLDRLVDDPRAAPDSRVGREQGLERLQASIRRDLEWLLNTRQLAGPAAGMPLLEDSLLALGLPEFGAANLGMPQDQERLRRAIEAAIRRFEPRLRGVAVTLVKGGELERALHFRIDAVVRAEPDPEPVLFDSVLQLGSNAFVVRDGG